MVYSLNKITQSNNFLKLSDYIKEKTHYDPDTTIIIGDSLTSDIKGGENAGIDTCYFNPAHQKNTSQAVTYEIDKLIEVLDIVK